MCIADIQDSADQEIVGQQEVLDLSAKPLTRLRGGNGDALEQSGSQGNGLELMEGRERR